jgi:hypothetical protein
VGRADRRRRHLVRIAVQVQEVGASGVDRLEVDLGRAGPAGGDDLAGGRPRGLDRLLDATLNECGARSSSFTERHPKPSGVPIGRI